MLTILCRDRRRPVPILLNIVLLVSLGVLERPASLQQPKSRSIAFLSVLKVGRLEALKDTEGMLDA